MGSPTIVAVIALLAWAPVVLALFVLQPARRAAVVGSVAAWLILPPIGLDVSGLPPYTKATAATAGILAGTLIFEFNRLLAFRLRWFDLPMIVWSLCPFASSLSNDLGVYDGGLRRIVPDAAAGDRLVSPLPGREVVPD
jgi:hypothetical protein